MRDQRFVAEHRGGPLKKEQHKQLIRWAYGCVEHVLPLLAGQADTRILHAIFIAREWGRGRVPTGEAMKASLAAHAAAREAADPVEVALARAAGQAVATAHMSDHSLGGALYALKAVKAAGCSVEDERQWQVAQLPPEVKGLVLEIAAIKAKSFRM